MAESPIDLAVVGGGVIGLAIAWRAAQRNLSVTVIDPAPGQGASHYAAGMLAPVTEVHYGEESLLQLNLAAAQRYPSFVAELEAASGVDVAFRRCGTLAVAFDADDKAVLRDLHGYQTSLGLTSHALTSRECRVLEPFLAPSVRGGLLVEDDHQVDNRRLVRALHAACERHGVRFEHRAAERIIVDDRAHGIDGIEAHATVLAAGCWSARLHGLPPEAVPPVRPVKGQIVRLRDDPSRPILTRTVRAFVRGRPIYLVPRADGEIVLGATSEELGYDRAVTVGAVSDLLADARELLPGLSEVTVTETSAGLRPGSPDNGPLVGPTAIEGLLMATGHYRNGILLAPITADAVATFLSDAVMPAEFAAFTPTRFGAVGALT